MTLPVYNPVPLTDANVITFIKTDPLGVGFAAIRAANPGADAPLMAAANAVSNTYAVPNTPITASTLLDLIDAAEFSAMTTAQLTQLQAIFSVQSINIGEAPTQAKLNSLLANYPNSLASVQAQYKQPGSPWEYYFGVGQQASTGVLDSARNSSGGNQF